jgi:hypothetical protein
MGSICFFCLHLGNACLCTAYKMYGRMEKEEWEYYLALSFAQSRFCKYEWKTAAIVVINGK